MSLKSAGGHEFGAAKTPKPPSWNLEGAFYILEGLRKVTGVIQSCNFLVLGFIVNPPQPSGLRRPLCFPLNAIYPYLTSRCGWSPPIHISAAMSALIYYHLIPIAISPSIKSFPTATRLLLTTLPQAFQHSLNLLQSRHFSQNSPAFIHPQCHRSHLTAPILPKQDWSR